MVESTEINRHDQLTISFFTWRLFNFFSLHESVSQNANVTSRRSVRTLLAQINYTYVSNLHMTETERIWFGHHHENTEWVAYSPTMFFQILQRGMIIV